MKIKLPRNQIVLLFLLLLLILLLFIFIKSLKQKQEIRKRAAGTGIVQLTLSPTGVEKAQGETFDIAIKLTSTESVQVGAATIKLAFNTDVFSVSAPTCESSFPLALGNSVNNNAIYSSCGVQTGGNPVTLAPGTPVDLAKFQVTVKAQAPPGQTEISFNPTVSVVAKFPGGEDVSDGGTTATYTITGAEVTGTPTPTTSPVPTATGTPVPTATATPRPTATATPIPTATPTTPPGDVKVRFKIKFAGVNQQRANQSIRVKVLKDGFVKQELPFSSVSVSAGASGVYQSGFITLSSAVTAGGGYTFLVKGPKHLQTLFCIGSGQTRPCDPHLSRDLISLNNGENTLNFTTYPLPAGDLPHPTYGQDGVVNSIDATLLVSCFADPQGQSCLNQADINLDGIISSIDMELMNQTIYTRWEDE